MPALQWLLERHGGGRHFDGKRADFSFLIKPPRTLKAKISKALELYPCDLLFIHRDAERDGYLARRNEIQTAVQDLEAEQQLATSAVFVIPVRMTEAWLLIEEASIRRAAGNPAGRAPLGIPGVHRLEAISDPKLVLQNALRTASGYTGRRLANLHFPSLRQRVAELISDHSPLTNLPAFRRLEEELSRALVHLCEEGV